VIYSLFLPQIGKNERKKLIKLVKKQILANFLKLPGSKTQSKTQVDTFKVEIVSFLCNLFSDVKEVIELVI